MVRARTRAHVWSALNYHTSARAGGMDESARLERVYMNSTPRERTAAFEWARAPPPPPSSPRGKTECHSSLLEALANAIRRRGPSDGA